jgi:hypothetical protein
MSQIELMRNYPYNVQEDTFFKLIRKAENTFWGKQYGFNEMQHIRDFQRSVPIQDYESVKNYIGRLRDGEPDLLWPGDTKWFAKSSGTTSDKSKFIPVTKEALEDNHFRGGKDMLALYMAKYPESQVFKGKTLAMGGSHSVNNFSNESFYGDLSAVIIQNLPFWAEFMRIPNREIALMEEWEEKIEKMAENTVQENVTCLMGVPSWTLVLLRKVLEKTGKSSISEVWPNLELFIHGGVSFIPYKEQFRKFLPSPEMKFMETYNASEGFFAIQDDLSDPGMLLMLDLGIFYEFIPVENISDQNPPVYHIGEVELNRNYAMVITTNGGLWRYSIGDTVKFVSLNPHKIVITGRTKHFINAFGEELMIDNAEQAIKKACEKTNALVKEYTAAPVFMENNTAGAHQWLFEFEKEPACMDMFMEVLDNALKNLNSDYEAKRYKNMTLRPPIGTIVPDNTFYKWLKTKGKLGGQNKVPRLMNSRNTIEEIVNIIES